MRSFISEAEISVRGPAGSSLGNWAAITRRALCSIGWLFPRNMTTDTVGTAVRFTATPEAVWQKIMLYEDVRVRPPFPLRALLPNPLRTDRPKAVVGAVLRCRYEKGELLKRITEVKPPLVLRFEVVGQRLGIEGCITALGGSYEIWPRHNETDVVLFTNYRGHLRPRNLWHPLERFLIRQLHRHILEGMRAAVPIVKAAYDAVGKGSTRKASLLEG